MGSRVPACSNRSVTAQTAHQLPNQRIMFRMAVNVADCIVEKDDLYGDGVNVAARLQAYAEPGGIIISGAAAEQADGVLDSAIVDLGDLPLRSLVRPVRVFALRPPAAPPSLADSSLVGAVVNGSEPRPSIAVLPFRRRQTSPEEGYFADGVVDDIIHGLSSLKDLFVVSRASVLGYGGTTLDVRAVGRELRRALRPVRQRPPLGWPAPDRHGAARRRDWHRRAGGPV